MDGYMLIDKLHAYLQCFVNRILALAFLSKQVQVFQSLSSAVTNMTLDL
jgi:hypothetical protein